MQHYAINFSAAKKENFRLDPEYFKVLKLLDRISLLEPVLLSDESSLITQGPNPHFAEQGLPCLTGRNIADGKIQYEGSDIVSIEDFEFHKKFHLKPLDILITLKGAGSTGKVAIFTDAQKAMFSRNLGIVRIASQNISPAFTYAFLSSNIGQQIIDRGVTGATGQLTLPTSYIKSIYIPRISQKFQGVIEEAVLKAFSLIESADNLYNQAQDVLEQAVKFKYEKKNVMTFVNSSQKTKVSKRIDAEYFEPSIIEIMNHILANNGTTLDKVVVINDANVIPENDSYYKYIELSNIKSNGEVTNIENVLGSDLPTRARRKVKTNDIIISSVEGSLESIALIDKNLSEAFCSTGFFVLNSQTYNPETLFCIMKNPFTQVQLKRGCSGTILTAISKEELQKVVLPQVEKVFQNQISEIITHMNEKRDIAKQLLSIAKTSIDKAIEKDEIFATQWIQTELDRENITV